MTQQKELINTTLSQNPPNLNIHYEGVTFQVNRQVLSLFCEYFKNDGGVEWKDATEITVTAPLGQASTMKDCLSQMQSPYTNQVKVLPLSGALAWYKVASYFGNTILMPELEKRIADFDEVSCFISPSDFKEVANLSNRLQQVSEFYVHLIRMLARKLTAGYGNISTRKFYQETFQLSTCCDILVCIAQCAHKDKDCQKLLQMLRKPSDPEDCDSEDDDSEPEDDSEEEEEEEY